MALFKVDDIESRGSGVVRAVAPVLRRVKATLGATDIVLLYKAGRNEYLFPAFLGGKVLTGFDPGGAMEITFGIYDSDSGNPTLIGDAQPKISDDGGLLDVSVTGGPIQNISGRYVGFTVTTGPTAAAQGQCTFALAAARDLHDLAGNALDLVAP